MRYQRRWDYCRECGLEVDGPHPCEGDKDAFSEEHESEATRKMFAAVERSMKAREAPRPPARKKDWE
jgi:hypothetical protein